MKTQALNNPISQRPRLTKKNLDKILDHASGVSRVDENRVRMSGMDGSWEVYYSSKGDSFSAFRQEGSNNRYFGVDVRKDGVYVSRKDMDLYAPSYYHQPATKVFDGRIPASESMRVGMNVVGGLVGIPVALLSPDLVSSVVLK